MATEADVQLPVDSASNKNKIRVLEIIPDSSVAGGDGTTQVMQEVVTLGDDDGFLLLRGGMGAKVLPVSNREVVARLDQLIEGIAHLSLLLRAGLRPKNPMVELDAWIDGAFGAERSAN